MDVFSNELKLQVVIQGALEPQICCELWVLIQIVNQTKFLNNYNKNKAEELRA